MGRFSSGAIKHFEWSLIVVIAGMAASFWRGSSLGQSGFSFMLTALVISVLEVAISFDNAVVNAEKLEHMSDVWRERFLTWGIFIAVFGMRLLFPILVVSVFAGLPFGSVVNIALTNPDEYVGHLHSANSGIVTFGGMFLLMLFLKFFIDDKKRVDWIKSVERPLKPLAKIMFVREIVSLLALGALLAFLPAGSRKVCAVSGLAGIALFLLIDKISAFLERNDKTSSLSRAAGKAGFAAFLYLELIDASFSLDGVLGAFAFTKDVVVIVVGLGIGAMFVRSLTLMLVEKKTLSKLKYLTHGAYWAIGVLAAVMLVSAARELPEAVAATASVAFIAAAVVSSVRSNRRHGSER